MLGLSIVNGFDKDKCFWKTNPQFKALDPFKELYNSDSSKGKTVSSNLMWGLAFYGDRESLLKNLPLKFKLDRIKLEFGGVDLSLDEYKIYVEAFELLCLSEAERALRVWEEKMSQRNGLIATTEYNMENAADLDKVLEKTPKLFIELQRLKEQVLKEGSSEGKAMGGIMESASDRGEI